MPSLRTSALGSIASLQFAVPLAGAQTAPVVLTRLVTIGCEECSDARRLAKINDVAVTSQGEILVTDREAPMLRVFSRDGKPLRQFGRLGSGPGEYRFPMRATFGPGGSIHVLDMTARRITHLGADGSVTGSIAIGTFPGAVAARGENGELVVLSDDFRGTLTLQRWAPDAGTPALVATVDHPPRAGGGITIPGIALSRDGEIALALDNDQYRIARLAPDGKWLTAVARDIPRAARTKEEIAELEGRLRSVGARAAEAAQSKGPPPKGLNLNPPDLSLKPHFFFDGMRYDQRGRLWVLTSRGSAREAIIDVFARDGAFIGSLRIQGSVQVFALGGDYLVTAGERDDGTPVAELWSVKDSSTPR